ncbi:tetratricopeptide repeat-containing sensor histidine kinase [Ekhidna sp.]|uniref:tetratricopeptide repeat-containing sensor histidine kinase n=1 Tax=Ekhidna sp. TaxID=2608089 RepID=UPI003BAC3482
MEIAPSIASTKVHSLLDEAYKKRVSDLTSSIKLTEEALLISKELDDKLCIGRSLSHLSLYHMIIGDFDLSINMANEAIENLEEVDDEKGIADAKYTIAGALYKTDDYNLGLTYLVDCLKTYKKHEDYHNQARVEKSMGTIYEFFGDVDSAIKIYESSIESGKKADDLNLQSNAFNPLSGIYLNQGQIKEAMDLIEKSIAYKEKTKDIRGLAFALYGRGKVYTETEEFDKAEADFLEAERIHEEMGEKLGLAMCLHKRGALYIKMDLLDKAENILVEALEYSNKRKIILIKFRANLLLHEIAKQRGNHVLALKYLQQYIDEKESVINDRTAKVIESYDVINRMNRLEQDARIQKEKADIIEKKKIELDSFFYRISHDLKGPITSLMSLNYVAKLEVQDETALRFIDDYEKQANRLNNILDGLIKLTKMSFNEDSKQEIDFEKVIYDCIASYKFLANFDSVEFKIDVDSSIKYEAEWALVNTIIQNLIENGIKYARLEDNKPTISISVKQDVNGICIEAIDNGIGMDQETVDKIFSMFFRVNRTIDGTGLGLHILKRAVERLNGEVAVKSRLGEGTTFCVSLPK